MFIINTSTGQTLASRVEWATTFKTRLKGLMGRTNLLEGSALVIAPCSSIHTCFMRFPIDVIFLDKGNRVLAVRESMSPFRFSRVIKDAARAVELPAGTVEQTGTQQGHYLKFNPRGEYD